MNNYVVYVHTNKINGKKYVGTTCQSPNRRWKNGNGYRENEHFYRAICRYGWDNFTHEIVRAGLSKESACRIERELIAEFKSNQDRYGYNKSIGGENPNGGNVMSDEAKRKMSIAHKGKRLSDECKRKLSEQAKARGNGKAGKVGKDCGKAGLVKQIDIKTGDVIAEYYGFYEMERATGFGIVPVRRAAKGKQKQSHGYRWEYIPRREMNVVV